MMQDFYFDGDEKEAVAPATTEATATTSEVAPTQDAAVASATSASIDRVPEDTGGSGI